MSKNIVNSNKDEYTKKREEVLTSFFLNSNKNPVNKDEIIALMQVPSKDIHTFNLIISNLEKKGIICVGKKGKIYIVDNKKVVKCKYQAKSKNYGFGIIDEGKDVYIASENSKNAMNDDDVIVEIINIDNNTQEGNVLKIVNRNTDIVIGTLSKSKTYGFVLPINTALSDIYISKENIRGYKDGEVVKVKITKYPDGDNKAEGKIIGLVAKKDEKNQEVKALYVTYGLDSLENFSKKIEEELEQIPDFVSDEEKKNRVDRTNERCYTIDASDAKDLDDAVFVKKKGNNYVLSVYIADVSHYVKERTELNKEAIKRGTSIYIPGKVIPMLPKKLSNGICSLNENEERLSLACDMVISNTGKVLSSEILKAVIKVTKKMSYDKVFDVITDNEDDDLKREYGKYKQDLKLMEELARILNNKRIKEGSINFDIPETHIILDEEGNVKRIEPYKITFANQIIEEFMLVTNMVVAESFYFYELPFIYRIHEKPDDEKIQDLNLLLQNYNLRIKGTKDIHPKALSDILDSVENENIKDIISTYVLRSLKLAKYSEKCLGHFGLNAKYYCHFTSPIRRYPDLFIHRIISHAIDNNYVFNDKEMKKYEKQAEKYAKSSSEMEKNATKIERDFDDLYSCIYMRDFIGKKFNSKISSITNYGMFVQLENTVEGFIPYVYSDDWIIYDEKTKTAYGEHTKKQYKIGDEVKVKLIKSNVLEKQIDFELV